MTAKKPVRSRIVFAKGSFNDSGYLDVTSTFNMTERAYLDRDPDMLVETEDGMRLRVVKSTIIGIKEIMIVQQVAEETGATAGQMNAAGAGGNGQ